MPTYGFKRSWMASTDDTKRASNVVREGGGTIFSFRQAAGGAVSSSDLNSLSQTISQSLQRLRSDWRTYTRPILNSLPGGDSDQRWSTAVGKGLPSQIDCFAYGIQGATLFVLNDADGTKADGRYWESTEFRPKTIAEVFEDVFESISEISEAAEAEDVDLDPLWAAIGENYRTAGFLGANGSLDARAGDLETYINQLNSDIYDPETYSYQIGAPVPYSIASMLDNLLQLHNVSGGWGADPSGASHNTFASASHTHAYTAIGPPSATASTQTRIGPMSSLQNDILRLRYEIQYTRGSASWYADVTSPFVGTPVANLGLHVNYTGSGTAATGNPHGIDYTDTGAGTIFTAVRGFTGMSSNVDNSPTYSSTTYVNNGDSLETAIGKLDAAVPVGGGSLNNAYNYGGNGLGNDLVADWGAVLFEVTNSAYTNHPVLELRNEKVGAALDAYALELSGDAAASGIIKSVDLDTTVTSLGMGMLAATTASFTGDVRLSLAATHDGSAGDADIAIGAESANGLASIAIAAISSDGSASTIIIEALTSGAGTIEIGCYDDADNQADVNICTMGSNHEITIGSLTAGRVDEIQILADGDIDIESNEEMGLTADYAITLLANGTDGAHFDSSAIFLGTDLGVAIGSYDKGVLYWAMGNEAINLDFTGTNFNTKSKCDQVGFKFNSAGLVANSPFVTAVLYNCGSDWAHTAGEGWRSTDVYGTALVPLCRDANWEAEITFTIDAQVGGDLSVIALGVCGHGGRVSWYATSYAEGGVDFYDAELLTNDGDDTFTSRFDGDIIQVAASPYTLKIRSLNGTIGVWDDDDDTWDDYEGTWGDGGAVNVCYPQSYIFIQMLDVGEGSYTATALESFKLSYLN